MITPSAKPPSWCLQCARKGERAVRTGKRHAGASPGDSPQVERATGITHNDWAPVTGHLASLSVWDPFPPQAATTYLYRVRSGITISGTDYPSTAASNLDYATVASTLFTDEPLLAGVTSIKGIHLGELHQAIDAVRRAAGLDPAWSSYGPVTGPVTASDNIAARQKLDEAVTMLVGHGVFYSGEVPAMSGKIFAYQIQQIRDGVR